MAARFSAVKRQRVGGFFHHVRSLENPVRRVKATVAVGVPERNLMPPQERRTPIRQGSQKIACSCRFGDRRSAFRDAAWIDYFAGAGSGAAAPLFGCGFINSVSAAPAMSRMPAVMNEDW